MQQGISKLNSLSNQRRQQHLAAVQPQHGRQPGSGGKNFEELKRQIHRKLVDKLDLTRVSDLSSDALRREIRLVVEHLCDTENPLLNRNERERLIDEVLDETFGFGPLEMLLKDPTISDILINGPQEGLRRAPRQAGEDRRQVPRQRPPAADHRPHRVEGRPARGRNLPDGRRPPAGRLPRERDHSAAGPGRPERVAFAASAPTRSSSKTC